MWDGTGAVGFRRWGELISYFRMSVNQSIDGGGADDPFLWSCDVRIASRY
jgi:hypothetical protein